MLHSKRVLTVQRVLGVQRVLAVLESSLYQAGIWMGKHGKSMEIYGWRWENHLTIGRVWKFPLVFQEATGRGRVWGSWTRFRAAGVIGIFLFAVPLVLLGLLHQAEEHCLTQADAERSQRSQRSQIGGMDILCLMCENEITVQNLFLSMLKIRNEKNLADFRGILL